MKTGTPPRVDGRSLDFSKMTEQPGDTNPKTFSYLDNTSALSNQRSCHMTYTSDIVHDLLKEGFDRSRCLMEGFKVLGLGTALQLKTRSIDLPIKKGTKFLLNQKAGILSNII